jgi:ribonuclease BN (tRNA processing enzyme)
MMELTVLGSGTAIPSARRGSPGYLLRSGERLVLLDCGPGSLREAAAAGVGPADIDAVLLTHFHPDHNLDLMALLFALRNPLFAGCGPLEVVAPEGFGEILDHWCSGVQGAWLTPEGYDLSLREIGEGEHDVAGLAVTAIHVEHTPQSLAYRVREEVDGPVIAYSGDTGLCDAIVTVGRGADLFVLECAVPDSHPFPGHLTPSEAAEVAERADPKRLVLTHFYPPMEHEPVEEVVRRRFRGRIDLAEDGACYVV